ncbi:hypothetical protein HMPREF9420_2757 [Segatella salivae DSM 15606]|uniref:Uncharacterized protein n=1 Tax=Segatella salivae DSM 15606 TaxID=888832 RepID=E6MTD9_9BACT|nr:hypothetical protein HMPREF9420_2757 [Segatella salivae DSM 15606]
MISCWSKSKEIKKCSAILIKKFFGGVSTIIVFDNLKAWGN